MVRILILIALVTTPIASAVAADILFYNKECQFEILQFVDASNADDIATSRQALTTCVLLAAVDQADMSLLDPVFDKANPEHFLTYFPASGLATPATVKKDVTDPPPIASAWTGNWDPNPCTCGSAPGFIGGVGTNKYETPWHPVNEMGSIIDFDLQSAPVVTYNFDGLGTKGRTDLKLEALRTIIATEIERPTTGMSVANLLSAINESGQFDPYQPKAKVEVYWDTAAAWRPADAMDREFRARVANAVKSCGCPDGSPGLVDPGVSPKDISGMLNIRLDPYINFSFKLKPEQIKQFTGSKMSTR